jgi:hypothetical protein
MQYAIKQILACGWLCAAFIVCAACTPKRIPAMTVTDLMEDRVTLDGVLMKCNQNRARARNDADCLNARIAIERLAKDVDPAEEERRKADFERRREQLRSAQEKLRQEQEAKTKVDAYSLPLVPVESTPMSSGAPSSAAAAPLTGQTRP